MLSEKRLYDLLITVYRSPELMIKMTGAKQQYLKESEDDFKNQTEGGDREERKQDSELLQPVDAIGHANQDKSK